MGKNQKGTESRRDRSVTEKAGRQIHRCVIDLITSVGDRYSVLRHHSQEIHLNCLPQKQKRLDLTY